VDWKGQGYNDIELKTEKLLATTDPDWGSNGFVFSYKNIDSFDKAAYVRLEVLVDNVPIGASFIPIEYFGLIEKRYQFPVSPCRNIAKAKLGYASGGELTVSIKSIQEDKFSSSSNNARV
jgi:hypothetical protein